MCDCIDNNRSGKFNSNTIEKLSNKIKASSVKKMKISLKQISAKLKKDEI